MCVRVRVCVSVCVCEAASKPIPCLMDVKIRRQRRPGRARWMVRNAKPVGRYFDH